MNPETFKALPPKAAIREMCKDCLGLSSWDRKAVTYCEGDRGYKESCVLFPYRLGKRISVKLFRRECLNCQGGSLHQINACVTVDCPLYIYRTGKNEMNIGKRRKNKPTNTIDWFSSCPPQTARPVPSTKPGIWRKQWKILKFQEKSPLQFANANFALFRVAFTVKPFPSMKRDLK